MSQTKPVIALLRIIQVYGLLSTAAFAVVLTLLIVGTQNSLGKNLGLYALCPAWSGVVLLIYSILAKRGVLNNGIGEGVFGIVVCALPSSVWLVRTITTDYSMSVPINLNYFVGLATAFAPTLVSLALFVLFFLLNQEHASK